MGIGLLFTTIYILFIVFELIPMFKSKQYKLFTVWALIMTLAYVIQILTLAGYTAPALGIDVDTFMSYFKK